MEKFQPRRGPPHTRPGWVSPNDPLFITFASNPRNLNQLANPRAWEMLQHACLHLESLGRWHPQLILAMPDHVHLVAQVPAGVEIRRIIASIKRALTRECGIQWQRDFFDHRPRNKQGLTSTRDYILMNPVRKGLSSTPAEWPYKWRSSHI